jgi:hypothetical protein
MNTVIKLPSATGSPLSADVFEALSGWQTYLGALPA